MIDLTRIIPETGIRANPVELCFCWHLRVGLFRDLNPLRVQDYASFFYRFYLNPHFQRQEELVLRSFNLSKEITKKTISNHKKLRRLFLEPGDAKRSFGLIEEKLEEHVRFEQKVLLKELKIISTQQEFNDLLAEQLVFDKIFYNILDGWKDKYWDLE